MGKTDIDNNLLQSFSLYEAMTWPIALTNTDFNKGRRYADSVNIRFMDSPVILLQFKAQWLFEEHYYDMELWLSGDLAKKWTANEQLRKEIINTVKPIPKFTYNTDKTGMQWAFVGYQGIQLESGFKAIEDLSITMATDLQTNWKPFLLELTNALNTPR